MKALFLIFILTSSLNARHINIDNFNKNYEIYSEMVYDISEQYNMPVMFIWSWCFWENDNFDTERVSKDTLGVRIQINVGILQIASDGTEKDIKRLSNTYYNITTAIKILKYHLAYEFGAKEAYTLNELKHGLTMYSGGRGSYQRRGKVINNYAKYVIGFYMELLKYTEKL